MKILSLFDGMACGAIALTQLDIPITRYVAYEIDQHAVKLAAHNFCLEIEHRGDVFDADFSEFEGFDYLMGGSPCTFWSIAQSPDKRETVASGIGWELFSQYVRALRESKPKFFIYENNKSMSIEIRRSISETFGFEPILINSALVSAQNRNRLYWVGKRNEQGGYDKVEIEQPADRGILLKDILDGAQGICTQGEKSQTLKAQYAKNSAQNGIEGGRTHGATMVSTPVKRGVLTNLVGEMPGHRGGHYGSRGQKVRMVNRVYGIDAKSRCVDTDSRLNIAEPTCVAQRGRYSDTGNRHSKSGGEIEQHFEARADGKTNTLTCVQKDNHVAEPAMMIHTAHGFNVGGVREQNKANTLTTSDYQNNHKVVEPYPWATPEAEAKREVRSVKGVYEVKNGQITIEIKGEPRTYPIKLADGFYIIRKLTVAECARLQQVPDWYDFSVISNTQAYKCLGNGWSVEVIMHLIRATLK